MSAKRRTDGRAEWRSRRYARLAVIAVAAGMLVASGAAVAGDYYVSGGIGFDRPGNTAFSGVDCSSTAPAALYVCGTGDDGAPYRSVGDFETVPAVELGLGYVSGPARFEVLVEYRPHFSFKGRANFLESGGSYRPRHRRHIIAVRIRPLEARLQSDRPDVRSAANSRSSKWGKRNFTNSGQERGWRFA